MYTRLLIALLCLTGCAHSPPAAPNTEGNAATPAGRGRIVQVINGELLTPTQAASTLQQYRVIYIGEQHNKASHHEVQRRVLEELVHGGAKPAIGLEMVSQAHQDVLDEWIGGDLTEAQLIRRLDWENTWGFPYELYGPLFRLAQEEQLPMVALNVPRALTKKLAKVGREGLDPEERAICPPLTSGNKRHRAYIKQFWEAHPGHTTFPLFYQAQLAWDEGMASAVDKALSKHDQIVVLAGKAHVEYALGIPSRARTEDHTFAIILPVTRGHLHRMSPHLRVLAYPKKVADFFWESDTDPHQGAQGHGHP